MSYDQYNYMSRESEVIIPAENAASCVTAMKRMPKAFGLDIQKFRKCLEKESLTDALDMLGFDWDWCGADEEDSSISIIGFQNFQEEELDQFMLLIAPFVEEGSEAVIANDGGDLYTYRLKFTDGTVYKVSGDMEFVEKCTRPVKHPITEKELADLRFKYKPGKRVRLVWMYDQSTKMPYGAICGTVTGVDDIGTIHVNWDNGSSLGVVWGEDVCELIEDNLSEDEYNKICEAWAQAGGPGSEGTIYIHSGASAIGLFDSKGNPKTSVSIVEQADVCEYQVFASEKDMYEAWIADWLEEASRGAEEFTPEYVNRLFEDNLEAEMCEKLSELYSNRE